MPLLRGLFSSDGAWAARSMKCGWNLVTSVHHISKVEVSQAGKGCSFFELSSALSIAWGVCAHMQGRPRRQVGAAVLLVCAALVATIPLQGLKDVALPTAALLEAQLPAAHLTAAGAATAGRHCAAALAQPSQLWKNAGDRPSTQTFP